MDEKGLMMKYSPSLFAVLTAVLCMLTTSLKANDVFEAKTYTSAEGHSLNYRIHIPENMDLETRYPFVLFFHGAGERGRYNKNQLVHGVKDILAYCIQSNTPVIIVAPQCPPEEQWVNTPWSADAHTMPENPSASMTLAIGLLKELRATLPVDETRIYVTGLSMGGFGVWDIIQRMPDTFAAAMPVCGGGDTGIASVIKDIPTWVFHGGSDSVVKTKRSRDMVAALEKVGGKVRYTEYKGVGHNSWDRAYNDKEALRWLLSQKRIEQTDDAEIK